MEHIYAITPLNDGAYSQKNNDPKAIPSAPFSMSLVAGKGSGKTTLIANLLMKKEFYRNQFDRIVIICPTLYADKKWELILKEKILKPNQKRVKNKDNAVAAIPKDKDHDMEQKVDKTDIHTEPNTFIKVLSDLRNEYTDIFKDKGKDEIPSTLIIMDDVLGLKVLRDATTVNFLSNSRHLNCSLIFSVQRYNGIPPTIRLQASFLTLFPTWSVTELRAVYDEMGPPFDEKTFIALVKALFNDNKQRRFIAFNNQNPVKYRMNDSFQRFILPDE